MALTTSQLKRGARPLTVTLDIDGSPVNVLLTYNPSKLTLDVYDRITEPEAGRGRERYESSFTELVSNWDLVDDNNQPVPVTKEALNEYFTFNDVDEMLAAILRDARPNRQSTTTT